MAPDMVRPSPADRSALWAWAGLLGLLVLCLAGPALAKTIDRTARPGQRIQLDGYSMQHDRAGCPSEPPNAVELVTPPRGGRVDQRQELMVLNFNTDGTRVTGPCSAVEQDATALYYTARADFSGRDTVSVAVTFSNGEEVTYTYRITVPAAERRQAPAVSQRPSPREDAAPAVRVAPASREASTVDFLRDTVRGAAPASPARPAAAPPKAEADASASASDAPAPRVPAESSAPRNVSPAPRPHSPATPQL
ncbi:hypothetical protein MKK63_19745 [Methylobacterium sp. J-088]|uniref:hypothetical protein n=1 Tax=Methylobacterium sp. J-088 TaxID=2836664 RepID=UPI001FB94D2A|nr:hypothetical protein [Methylobacterium sp. J-088]MCJ2064924.1 hypothetical protein [Methylobacterium sp. J-088]